MATVQTRPTAPGGLVCRAIAKVEVFPVRLRVTDTFTFASGSTGAAGDWAPHVFVKLTDSEGETGWGEARPVPSWSYETLESVTTTIRRYLAPAITGTSAWDRVQLHRRMLRAIGRGPSSGQPLAKAAVDMAAHDLCARAVGLPLCAFLGGAQGRRVALSFTITAHEPAAAAEAAAAAREQGYRHFNFKAALTPAQHAAGVAEAALAEAIRAAAGPEAFVWADANQGYRLHEARAAAERFRSAGVSVLEQPLPADQLPLMRALRVSTTLPLAVDESSVGPADFLAYAREELVDYLVIKLARSGGVWPTLQQIAVAEASGLPLLVSGLTESLLAKTAACHVASVFGFEGPAALNGSQFIDDAPIFPEKRTIEHDGAVHLGDAPGIGVRPDEDALRSLLVPELRV